MKLDIFKDFERYLYTKELSQSTVGTYIYHASLIDKFLRSNYGIELEFESLPLLKGYMVSNWASSISQLSVATRSLYITSANIFFRYLHAMQYVDFDLSTALPPPPNIEKYKKLHPEEHHEKRGYSNQELKIMLEALNPNTFTGSRTKAIIVLLVSTGLRVSELASLNVGDILENDGFIYVARKGTHGAKVKVPLPKAVIDPVLEFLTKRENHGCRADMNDPLFITSSNRRMTRVEIYRCLAKVQKDVGVHTGVHTFRHTALSHIAKTADPVVARDVAGQKSISVTNRYLHSSDEEMLAAVEKLAELL